MRRPPTRYVVGVFFFWISSTTAAAPAVWSGLTTNFSKIAFASPLLPQNQDHISDHVALTRGDNAGLFNALLETSFDRDTRTAPADTEWATDINNPAQTIAASNWAALAFTTWSAAYGDHVGVTIVNRPAVAHLITDDVYLNVLVTDWGGGESGGAFTYQRSTAPAASGDYNHNGFVDAADYTIWRDTLGQTVPLGTGADGNVSGMVDANDYGVWKNHFGQPAAGAGNAANVPEGDNGTLAVIGIVSALIFAAGRNGSIRLPRMI
jgi:hypothetical protein